ncbi:unannotated protein [freshwater metagenome]|uniref:Unannotated protein n=1 Tax=freshwater metagenome TaxID=449393 RepID=A0A6J7FGG8_9ZZZZ|nr:hypothetical protein [Actinomycetota bacterium]
MTSSSSRRPVVLLPFDRSGDSEAAIDRVAQLLPDAEVTVLTVWQPAPERRETDTSGRTAPAEGTGRLDVTGQDAALTRATVGVHHAADAGLLARPRCQAADSGVARSIVAVADEMDADLIVMGRHGRSGQRYNELGETVRGVLEHTGRTVLVISGRDVPHEALGRGGTASVGHGGVHVRAWVPRTPEDEQDGAA